MATYVGVIHKDKDSDYGISFPDFPGCITAGADMEEIEVMAHEALQFHAEGMAEDAQEIPLPMSLEQAKKHPLARNAAAFVLVKIDPPVPAVRVNVMLDGNLLRRIDRVAGTRQRSAFLNDAARAYLDSKRVL